VLRADGMQQSYEGVLVGADRARDLAVVQIQVRVWAGRRPLTKAYAGGSIPPGGMNTLI
jgi:hypothetical protein